MSEKHVLLDRGRGAGGRQAQDDPKQRAKIVRELSKNGS